MAQNDYGFNGNAGGGLLRVLGLIYLIKIIRRRRRRHRLERAVAAGQTGATMADQTGPADGGRADRGRRSGWR
jgi:hypothetical protein